MSLLATHENIVIPEEVTSTSGEFQRFPVSEAASGIEMLSLEEILRGGPWAFKASRVVTQSRSKMFPDTTTAKFHRDPILTGPGSGLS